MFFEINERFVLYAECHKCPISVKFSVTFVRINLIIILSLLVRILPVFNMLLLFFFLFGTFDDVIDSHLSIVFRDVGRVYSESFVISNEVM